MGMQGNDRTHTSSTKMTQGASLAASEKAARMFCSLSPSHLDSRLLIDIDKNDAPHSAAIALANRVFPVPAGNQDSLHYTAEGANYHLMSHCIHIFMTAPVRSEWSQHLMGCCNTKMPFYWQ